MSREEDAYVIERMGKLLAEIAIIVNGPEPHDTLWSYHDLPEKVRALKQAPPAAAVPPGYVLVPVGTLLDLKAWLRTSTPIGIFLRKRVDALLAARFPASYP